MNTDVTEEKIDAPAGDHRERLAKLLDSCRFLGAKPGTTISYSEMSPGQLASWLVDNGVSMAAASKCTCGHLLREKYPPFGGVERDRECPIHGDEIFEQEALKEIKEALSTENERLRGITKGAPYEVVQALTAERDALTTATLAKMVRWLADEDYITLRFDERIVAEKLAAAAEARTEANRASRVRDRIAALTE